MTGLQETFYIMSIVYMAVMFVIMIAIVSAVFVIRSKVNHIHDTVEARLDSIVNLAEKGGTLTAMVGGKAFDKAAKALRKKKVVPALIKTTKKVFQEFGSDKVGQLSEAFAYTTIFAIGPLLLIFISIIGLIYGHEAAQGQLISQLSGVVGHSTAKTLQNVVAGSQGTGKGIIGLVIGAIGSLMGAAAITTQLQSSSNQILNVVLDPKAGIKSKFYIKLKNILVVLFGAILIAGSLVGSALVIGIGKNLSNKLGMPTFALEVLTEAVSFIIFTALIFGIYRVLPDVVIPRKIVLRASILVAILFLIGKIVLSIIIGRNSTASAYGAAASLVSLLLWVFYSGEIIFLGVEIMKVYAFNHSIEYKPKKFSLKQTTVRITGNSFGNKLTEAWIRGFRKHEQ